MKVARATFAVVVIAAGLAACTPPLPPEADPNGSLVSDSIAVLSVVPIEKGDSGSALIFINKSGHATRLQTDDTIGPAVVADDDSIYFSGTKNEYALTDGRLHSMPRHVDLHSQDALHVVQPDTRVGIFNEGDEYLAVTTEPSTVVVQQVTPDLLGTTVCDDKIYGLAADTLEDPVEYSLIDVTATPDDQVVGRWSPGTAADTSGSAVCTDGVFSFIHDILDGDEEVVESQVVRWEVESGEVASTPVTGLGGAYLDKLAAGSDPDTVSSFDEDSTLWQVDLRSGAAKRRFTLDDPPAAWARVGDTIYVVGQSDAGDSLRAIDARNGQHLAKAPLRDLIPDLAANGLAVTGLTVLNDSW